MITYWQQLEGNFSKVKKNTIDETLPLWIDARNVTRDETTLLQEEYQIEQDHILDILDPDELSRIEEGDGDYILTIVRVPVYDPQAETPYFTVPVGIIGKTPLTGRISPRRFNSPTNIFPLHNRSSTIPIDERIPIAIGRSNAVPFFLILPGARLMVMRFAGSMIPQL